MIYKDKILTPVVSQEPEEAPGETPETPSEETPEKETSTEETPAEEEKKEEV